MQKVKKCFLVVGFYLRGKQEKRALKKHKQCIWSPFSKLNTKWICCYFRPEKHSRDLKIHGSTVVNRTSCVPLQRPRSSLHRILNCGWYKIFPVGSRTQWLFLTSQSCKCPIKLFIHSFSSESSCIWLDVNFCCALKFWSKSVLY